MLNDPIVQAVRQVREELAAEFGYDVHQLCADSGNASHSLVTD